MTTTSSIPSTSSSHFVTFQVDEVNPARRLLEETSYQEAIEAYLGQIPLKACSVQGKKLVSLLQDQTFSNSFIRTIHIAFAEHRPLTLSPDHIWLLICQGVAQHIQQHAETMRSQFVDFQGKKTLTVEIEKSPVDDWSDDSHVPWEEIFPAFSQQILEQVGHEIHDFFLTHFSTTGIVEKNVFEITLMDSMQMYFDYEMELICGIPQITLEGVPRDWQTILEKIETLRRFGLGWWADQLIPVLKQFVQASQGIVDQAFWKAIFVYRDDRDCQPSHQEEFFCITGWCTKLFPYLSNIPDTNFSNLDSFSGYQIAKTNMTDWFFKNPFIEAPLMETTNYAQGIVPSTLPNGISMVPLVITRLGEFMAKKYFLGGFLGISQDAKTMAIRPEIAWAVVSWPPTEEEKEAARQRAKLDIHVRWREDWLKVLVHRREEYRSKGKNLNKWYREVQSLFHITLTDKWRNLLAQEQDTERLKDLLRLLSKWHDASKKQAVNDIKDIKEQLRFLMRVRDHRK